MATTTIMARVPTSFGTDTGAGTGNAAGVPVISVVLDASITEMHTLANTVTDHPVEQGSNVTDHSRPEPDRVQLDCLVSNTPLSQQQQTRAIQAQGGLTFQSTAAAPTKIGAVDGRAQTVYGQLRQLRDNGILCKVVTQLRTYDSMAIESIGAPRDSKTFDALRFSIQFKQVRVVQNKLTRVAVAKDLRVGSKVKTGNQTPSTTDVETSAAAKIFDGAKDKTGFIGKVAGGLGALVQ